MRFRMNKEIEHLETHADQVKFPKPDDGNFDRFTRMLREVLYENGMVDAGFKVADMQWDADGQVYTITCKVSVQLTPEIKGAFEYYRIIHPKKELKTQIQTLLDERTRLETYEYARTAMLTKDPEKREKNKEDVGTMMHGIWS